MLLCWRVGRPLGVAHISSGHELVSTRVRVPVGKQLHTNFNAHCQLCSLHAHMYMHCMSSFQSDFSHHSMLKNCVTPRMLLMHVLAQPRAGPPCAHPWPSALPHWALPSQLRHAHPQKVDLETQHTTAGLPRMCDNSHRDLLGVGLTCSN